MDPYERADITSDQYYDWLVKNVYLTAYGDDEELRPSSRPSSSIRPASGRRASRVDQIMEDVMKRIEQEKQKR